MWVEQQRGPEKIEIFVAAAVVDRLVRGGPPAMECFAEKGEALSGPDLTVLMDLCIGCEVGVEHLGRWRGTAKQSLAEALDVGTQETCLANLLRGME